MSDNSTVKLYHIDYGVFVLLESSINIDHVQNAIANGIRWEPDVMALCEKYVQPNTTVLDIGANIGTFTVRLAQLVGANGTVHAFEPQRIIYQQLCANIFLNKLRNVYAHQVAIGANSGEVTLTPINYDSGAPGEVRIHGDSGERVEIIKIDDYEYDSISLIKVDVERYEPFVFDGAKKTIEKHRPVILFELTTLPLPEYPENYVIDLLTKYDYNIYQISDVYDFVAIPKERDNN